MDNSELNYLTHSFYNMFKINILFIFFSIIVFSCKQNTTQKEDIEILESKKTWDYLKTVPVPTWFDDAKFGIFLHWGPYSVPGWSDGHYYSEWYSTAMYIDSDFMKYHSNNYGSPPEFGYKDFVPLFQAQEYDADEWAYLLKSSGAQYVIPTAEHHDGFAMWDTDLTPWNSVDKGPKLDYIGTLGDAIRKVGLYYGISYHRERHWGFYTNSLNTYTESPTPYAAILQEIEQDSEAALLYGPFQLDQPFMEDYKNRFLEICRKYRPDFMWIDDAPSHSKFPNAPAVSTFINTYHREMIAEYIHLAKGWGKEVYWNNKRWRRSNYPEGAGVDEKDYLRTNDISPIKWQSSGGMAHSYGYDRTEDDASKYKTSEQLIETLIDVVSKNGNFLLAVGPTPEGTFTELQKSRLKDIGKWLQTNGEAIYETRPWTQFGYGDIRFTVKKNDLYVLFLNKPSSGFKVEGLQPKEDTKITFIGNNTEINWQIDNENLLLELPNLSEVESIQKAAYVFKINDFFPNNN